MPKLTHLKTLTTGAALAEHGILIGLIAVVAIGSVSTLGKEVQQTFDTTRGALVAQSDPEGVDNTPVDNIPVIDTTHGSVVINPAKRPNQPNFVGYEGGPAATHYGTLISVSGDIPGLDIFRYNATDNSVAFNVKTDTTTVLVGKALSCQDGTVLNFDDANYFSYVSYYDHTRYRWDDVPTLPAFVVGEEFTCGIADR